ncbi:Inner membrane protein yjgN [Moraxella lacunata]|uniref:Inner membrane protein yjgN n=1 Tax=Moraxella lacunata TaxID=477 RepID=A0A378TPV8_MORLA|nr:YjgN family protein [Moraxella lacunata]STZ62895.1 Inner membrane protein yjgN [Moraxella lacunata]
MSLPPNESFANDIYHTPFDTPPTLPPAQPDEPYQYDFYFYGTGTEYFKIWIVNLLLTIITLGIYSPWAKVRRLRYFYGNTELNDEPFDFTANPKRILLGRLIALGVYVVISVLGQFSPMVAAAGGLLIIALFPWLVRSTLRFRARNSQYKNVRFAFVGSLLAAYVLFGLVIFANLLITGVGYVAVNAQMVGTGASIFLIGFALLAPFAWRLFKSYQFDNTQFGEMAFEWHASMLDVYKAVLIPIGIAILASIGGVVMIGLGAVIGSDFGVGVVVLAVIGMYLMMLLIVPLTQACLHKVVWGNLTIGESEFVLNEFSIFRFAFIQFTNFLLIGLTLGLFTPWAAVRLHRYKTETLSLVSYENFDEIITPQMVEESALGEEIADVFDIDVSW